MELTFFAALISIVVGVYFTALWAIGTRWLYHKAIGRQREPYPVRLILVNGDELKLKGS